MHISILCLLGGIVLIYFGVVSYAISRDRDVKASLKLPFAAFSFEANEPVGSRDKTLKERLP
jgi:hypothetical protein